MVDGKTASSAFEVVGTPSAERAGLVRELADLGFTWADMEQDPYWIDQAVMLPTAVHDELMRAAKQLWTIFDKAARFVHRKPELYELIQVPEVLWEALERLPMPDAGKISRYARFDFALDGRGGIKLLELNADTPTGYVEASVATPWMCERWGLATVNGGMAAKVRAAWSVEQPESAACVGYGEHLEDSGTIEMLVRHSGRKMKCVDCLDLWIEDGEVKAGEDEHISRMFALYPKEWMAVDDGGDALAYAVETGKLALFNPVHAILLQSKGLQAVIWGLHELKAEFFTAAEHAAIDLYMLPTYNKAIFQGNYVSKSMFGREGGSVLMFDSKGRLEHQDKEGFDTSRLFTRVYQKRAELAQIKLHAGTFHLLTGLFMLNGEPCGLLGRAGGPITGNSSHFIAMGVEK